MLSASKSARQLGGEPSWGYVLITTEDPDCSMLGSHGNTSIYIKRVKLSMNAEHDNEKFNERGKRRNLISRHHGPSYWVHNGHKWSNRVQTFIYDLHVWVHLLSAERSRRTLHWNASKHDFQPTQRSKISESESTADAVMRRKVRCVLRRMMRSQKPRRPGQAAKTTGLKLADTSIDHIFFFFDFMCRSTE